MSLYLPFKASFIFIKCTPQHLVAWDYALVTAQSPRRYVVSGRFTSTHLVALDAHFLDFCHLVAGLRFDMLVVRRGLFMNMSIASAIVVDFNLRAHRRAKSVSPSSVTNRIVVDGTLLLLDPA